MNFRGVKSTLALLTACSAVAIFAASGSAMAAPKSFANLFQRDRAKQTPRVYSSTTSTRNVSS